MKFKISNFATIVCIILLMCAKPSKLDAQCFSCATYVIYNNNVNGCTAVVTWEVVPNNCQFINCYANSVSIPAGSSTNITCCPGSGDDVYIVLTDLGGVSTGMTNAVNGCGFCGTAIASDSGPLSGAPCGSTTWNIAWTSTQTTIW